MTDQGQQPPRSPSFEERVDRLAEEAGEAGRRIGREAEEAGKRLAANPGVARATDTAARVWGLLLIAVGAWFFAEFTLGIDLPGIPWGEVWPLALIVVGLVVIVRGMSRRSI